MKVRRIALQSLNSCLFTLPIVAIVSLAACSSKPNGILKCEVENYRPPESNYPPISGGEVWEIALFEESGRIEIEVVGGGAVVQRGPRGTYEARWSNRQLTWQEGQSTGNFIIDFDTLRLQNFAPNHGIRGACELLEGSWF